MNSTGNEERIRIAELMAASGVKFGTSGARGLAVDMSDRVCYAYVRAFLQHLEGRGELPSGSRVAIAGDFRPSSPRIMAAAALAISDAGYAVVNCGFIPTPAVALYGIENGCPSLMVTGSHIPDDRNGIKFNTASGEILKEDEEGISAQAVVIPAGRFKPDGRAVTPYSLPPVDGEAEQGVQVARQITRESTEFAGGWFALAHHANSLYLRGRTEDVALREQALVAAEKLIALRPKAQEGYVYKALAMPPEQAVERERLLRDAVSRQAIYSDVGRAYLGDFLVQVGRLQEAFHLYRDHAQQNADVAMQHVRVFFAAAATERWPIAQEALEQVGTLGSSSMPLLLWRQAVWNGDWAEAERQIPFEHPAQVQAGIATYRALHAGDGARKEAAAQMVLALPTECCVPLRIEMLTALGRRSEALALLDQFEAGMTPGRRPGNVGLFLWDPALRSLWNEPGMEEFLRRHGWSAYWDTTRSQPDLCDQPRAPLFCQLLSIERF